MNPGEARPLRVLQIVDGLSMGGAETWLMECLRYWDATGKKVRTDFLCTGGEPRFFDGEAIALGAKVHYLKFGRRTLRQFITGFRRILDDGEYDAVHGHSDYTCGWHFAAGLGSLPPVRVAHVHNAWQHIEAYYGVTPLRRITAKAGKQLTAHLATNICGTSEETLRRYGFIPSSSGDPSVSVLHCGFAFEKFSLASTHRSVRAEFQWPDDSKVILFVGRLDPSVELDHPRNSKNSAFAIHVFREALKLDPGLRLIMAGAGEVPRSDLQSLAEGWGIADKLRLTGVRRDIPRLMAASDALFFPSRQEGLGMAAVEAQAAGLPVIASTGVPQEAEVVPHLFRRLALDRPIEDWARALVQATQRPREPVGGTRRFFEASPFTIQHSASRLERIYAMARNS